MLGRRVRERGLSWSEREGPGGSDGGGLGEVVLVELQRIVVNLEEVESLSDGGKRWVLEKMGFEG